MLSGPGALARLRNLTILMSVSESISAIIIHVRYVIIGVFRRTKIFKIILYKLVDLIEVFGIKVINLNAKCLSTDSAKSCALSALVSAVFASRCNAG